MKQFTESDVRQAIAQGNPIKAFDLAETALAQGEDSPAIKYLAVFSLARCGATDHAIARFKALELDKVVPTDASLAVDIPALWARLLKDKAFATREPGSLAEAAAAYEDVYRRHQASYPAVNAATLWLLAGKADQAQRMAQATLQALSTESRSYWHLATEAEARLVLGEGDRVQALLAAAAKAAKGDWGALASTRKQLALLLPLHKLDESVLAPLKAPAVVFFSGHRIGPRFPAAMEAPVAEAIGAELARLGVNFGYGSLASGADILFAEALLARGAELHVLLPFDQEEFKAVSVASPNGAWEARFEACLAAATSVQFATRDHYLGDDSLFVYTSRLAIGQAMLRSTLLQADCHHVVVWDGQVEPDQAAAGTSGDVARWNSVGRASIRIDSRNAAVSNVGPAGTAAPLADTPMGQRSLRAMLFGDIKGFSKLKESQLPIFAGEILGALAKVIAQFGAAVEFKNTWGDGIFIVTRTSADAARLGLAMQAAIKSLRMTELGLPPNMGLRLGAHFGPVFKLIEPVTEQENFFGDHVSRTARIEPITPEGCVYVTDAFAADLIATGAASDMGLQYVGTIPAAKGYGYLGMYALAVNP